LLVRTGFDAPEALMLLIPEAYRYAFNSTWAVERNRSKEGLQSWVPEGGVLIHHPPSSPPPPPPPPHQKQHQINYYNHDHDHHQP
jgi:hypothetical protein